MTTTEHTPEIHLEGVIPPGLDAAHDKTDSKHETSRPIALAQQRIPTAFLDEEAGVRQGKSQHAHEDLTESALWRRALAVAAGQWFMLGFLIVVLIAYWAPDVARHGGYLASQWTFAYGGLAIIFLIAGFTMPTDILISNLRSWKAHLYAQGMSFIITPLIGLAIVEIILAAKPSPDRVPQNILAGIIIMVCTPTTVASNITFTRLSRGNDATCLAEVVIGNLAGILISPALVQLLLRPSLGLDVGRPTQSISTIYRKLFEHFGPTLYAALFVGQCIRNLAGSERADRTSRKFFLPKVATVMLLLFLWTSFSDSFASKAYQKLPASAILLVVFLNLALYPLFTLIAYLLCRMPGAPRNAFWLTRGQTTAVCFCGPPKSITVGLVLITTQYSNFSPLDQAILTIPLSLYQGMQVFLAQAFVYGFKRWNALPEVPELANRALAEKRR
ncbi:LRR receptor-like serine/threonine-protein kinase RGI2 [Savitreella phatthalungensis]